MGEGDSTAAAAVALVEQSELGYVSPVDIAVSLAFAGDREQKLFWLESAVEEREPDAVYLAVQPTWDDLRSDPRFQDLVRRMNFPE